MKVEFSKSQLKKIGEKLRHSKILSIEEEEILSVFRLGHQGIMGMFRKYHKKLLDKYDEKYRGVCFASRLKKRKTLINKLASRHQHMDLSRMNDIAGCRLIFPNLLKLFEYRRKFIEQMTNNKRFKRLYDENIYNYIQNPRNTGYRGIHDVYEEVTTNSVKARIEIQYRTITQHTWSTALEIWDQCYLQGAKFGSEKPGIQSLFEAYSELLWRIVDRKNIENSGDDITCNGLKLGDEELFKQIRNLEQEYGVLDKLSKIKRIEKTIPLTSTEILLNRYVSSSPLSNIMCVDAQRLSWDMVGRELFENEQDEARDLVFVQGNPKMLRYAFKNYFNDTSGFVRQVQKCMKILYEKRSFLRLRQPLDPVFVLEP